MGHGPRQPHRPAPLRLAADREIDLARVRARRLSAAAGQVERTAPDDPRVLALYRDYLREEVLAPLELTAAERAEAEAVPPPADLAPPRGELLLVSLDGTPVAIGGVRDLDTDVAEVKSMYVAPGGRGRGLGRSLLGRLEGIAAEHGCRAVRLDTAAYLGSAIALYRSCGYREVPAYNENPNAALWFERALD